jgi:pimeloyl-ACP methyl ester carboxylesterase
MAWFEHGTVRIYYEEQGSGDPVLLLPGLTDRLEHHIPLRDALAAAGYRVIAADLPGSGRSQPQPRTYTVNYFEDDARAFAALLNHVGAVPAHVLGYSDGGETALMMATLFPNAARSLSIWGAAGAIDDPTGQLRQVFYNVVDDPIPPMKDFSQYLIATYGKDIARATTQSAVTAYTEMIESRGGDISRSKAHNITCPVLLIAGEHDPFASPALVAQLAARIRNVRVVEAKSMGHTDYYTQAGWLAQTILDWLKQHSSVAA